MGSSDLPAAILDVDGTLVDSNYHHAIAWHRALRRFEIIMPTWRLHRHIGMGGDKFVTEVCGIDVEERYGDEIREAHAECFEPLHKEVVALPGARELVRALSDEGRQIVLASSAKEHEMERYLELVEGEDRVAGWTTSADVEETKPAPELIELALEKAGGGPAAMVGDSVWDCESARRAGLETIGLLTGGFSEAELEDAGAKCVFYSLDELRESLAETPLGAA